MTTDDLVEILRHYPGRRVILQGYESGFADVAEVREQAIVVGANTMPSPRDSALMGSTAAEVGAGDHEKPGPGQAADEVAVLLVRAGRW
jgi:hypothetical protein